MKFGRNLEQVKEMSNPDWKEYWPDYNILKQLIKGLPYRDISTTATATGALQDKDTNDNKSACTTPSQVRSNVIVNHYPDDESRMSSKQDSTEPGETQASLLQQDRGERIFFKLLHAEVKKATHFFEATQQEYLKRANDLQKQVLALEESKPDETDSSEVLVLVQTIFQLHQELLQLETFAIMTYCGCSKILKKHDKFTGYKTREAFMANVVHSSSIAHTPQLKAALEQCQQWLVKHPLLSRHWNPTTMGNEQKPASSLPQDDDDEEAEEEEPVRKRKASAHDQQLFLETIERLHSSDSDEKPTAPSSKATKKNRPSTSLMSMLSVSTACQVLPPQTKQSLTESWNQPMTVVSSAYHNAPSESSNSDEPPKEVESSLPPKKRRMAKAGHTTPRSSKRLKELQARNSQ